jgi:hypothetical protein
MDSLDADATWAVPFNRAQLAAAAGDRDETVRLLRSAVEKNAVADYFMDKFSVFADYLDDPEIGPLIDTMVARRDRLAQLAASEGL